MKVVFACSAHAGILIRILVREKAENILMSYWLLREMEWSKVEKQLEGNPDEN